MITSRGFRVYALRAVYTLGLAILFRPCQLRENVKIKCRKRHGAGRGGDAVAKNQPLPFTPMPGWQVCRATKNRYERSAGRVAKANLER